MTGIFVPSLFLSVFGLVNVLGIKQSLFTHQLVFFIISLIIYFIVKRIGRNFFFLNNKFFYWLLIILLVVTYVMGLEVKGSKRWIDLYFFNFQPSEFLKIFFILFMGYYLTTKSQVTDKFSKFINGFLFFLIPTVIIFKQPDLGNAAVFLVIYLTMLLFSNTSKKYILYLIAFFLFMIPTGWFFLKSYQKERLISFINPHLDPQGNAYNMIQSTITVGSGKFFGRGLGLGTQSRFYFLPENHTDFAFASLVEQFGLFGSLIVIVLYLIIIINLIKRILHYFFQGDVESQRSYIILIGFLIYFVFQVVVNIGMNIGLFPVAGVALPFISYGGSSLVALMVGIALLP